MTHVSRTPALVSLNQLSFQFANGEKLFDALNLTFDQPIHVLTWHPSGWQWQPTS